MEEREFLHVSKAVNVSLIEKSSPPFSMRIPLQLLTMLISFAGDLKYLKSKYSFFMQNKGIFY